VDLLVGRPVPQSDIVDLKLPRSRHLPGLLRVVSGALPIVEYVLDPLDILLEGLQSMKMWTAYL
jgi:hypothetical protein